MTENSNNNNNQTMVTPKGTAMWAHLDKPEEFNGSIVGYTITFVPSKEDADKLISQLEEVLEDAKQNDERFKGRKWAAEPLMGYKEDADGNIVFKFKQKVSYVDKQGQTHKLGVRIFDSIGNPIDPKKTIIGNGSIVRVAFVPVPFNVNKNINGLSMKLRAVQVLKLEEYKKKDYTHMDSFGFSKVAGGFHTEQVFKSDGDADDAYEDYLTDHNAYDPDESMDGDF